MRVNALMLLGTRVMLAGRECLFLLAIGISVDGRFWTNSFRNAKLRMESKGNITAPKEASIGWYTRELIQGRENQKR